MDTDELLNDLNDHYSKKTLHILASYMELRSFESLNKKELIFLIIDNLKQNERFETLYSKISREAKIVLNHLVWYGISTLRHIESKHHIKISLDDFYGNTNDPFIKHFKSYYSKSILLSSGLRFLFKLHLKMPSSGNIVTSKSFPEGLHYVQSNDYVLNNIEALNEFIVEEKIRERDISKKILLKSLKRFDSLFNFKEPLSKLNVNDREIKDSGKIILLRFLSNMKSSGTPISSLINMLRDYRNGNLCSDNIDQYLFYPFIKGITSQYNIPLFLKRARFSILNMIKSFRKDEWVNVNSIVQSLSLGEETHIFDTSYFGSTLHIKVDKEYTRDFSNEIYLTYKENNENFLLMPLCRGIIALLYTLGAVDIGISKSVTHEKIKVDKEYLSPFDYISYFKITELGLKLFGLKSDYIEKRSDESSITIFTSKRIISVTGVNKSLTNFLNKIGKNIGRGNFLISYQSFLSCCNSEEDIYYNIDRLKKILNKNTPEIWNDFLFQLNDRIFPTYNEQELIIINFPRENEKFIETVVNNKKIRNLYSMVEGFRGAFNNKNYILFKKLMKDEGFYI